MLQQRFSFMLRVHERILKVNQDWRVSADAETNLLKEMAFAGLSVLQIYDGGRFPERTAEATNKQLERYKFAVARQKAFVETIEPSEDALGIEEINKLLL
jgi:hypothetical protein